MKEKAKEFIKKCHVFPSVQALGGGVVELESLLVDFYNEMKSYTVEDNGSDGVMALAAACREFVRKVEAGEARSKRSYAQMCAALELFGKEQHELIPSRKVLDREIIEGKILVSREDKGVCFRDGDVYTWGIDFGDTGKDIHTVVLGLITPESLDRSGKTIRIIATVYDDGIA